MKVCECSFNDVFAEHDFLPTGEAPICGEFEQTDPDDCDDCCKHCRHGERCHLEE